MIGKVTTAWKNANVATSHKLITVGLAWVSVLTVCTGLCVTTARARIVHVNEFQFGSEGAGSGQFMEPLGVAVNDVTHNVYVVDSGNDRVEEFSSNGSVVLGEFNGFDAPTGSFSDPTQIAVDNSGNPLDPSNGYVYVVDSGHNVIDKFNEGGEYQGQITGRCEKEREMPPCPKSSFVAFSKVVGVAVAPSGILWTVEKEGIIDDFSDGQPNQFISSRSTLFGGFLHTGLAVDSEENLYINSAEIAKVSSAGNILINPFDRWEEVHGGAVEASGVAVDAAHKEAYIDNITTFGRSNLLGEPEERFNSPLVESRGIAVDESTRAIYTSYRLANRVAVFAAVTLPTVQLNEPTQQHPTSVTLTGTVNPEGEPVNSCVFEYDEKVFEPGEASHGSQVACAPASLGTGLQPVTVSAQLSSLTPETKYYYRLVAANHGGSSEARGEVTPGPNIGNEFAAEVTSTSASVRASIDPNGDGTHYYFEYGSTTLYGNYAPIPPPGTDIGSARGALVLSDEIVQLQPGITYHYRVVATQDGETFEGSDRTFTTQPEGIEGTSGLLDSRAWELVSPSEKNGALIEFLPAYSVDMQAASDGSGIAYAAFGQLGEGPVGHTALSHVLSVREQAGWQSQDISLPTNLPPEEIAPSALLSGGSEYRLFSPNLATAAVEALDYTPALAPEITEECTPLYTRENSTGKFTPVVTPEIAPPKTNLCATSIGKDRMHIYTATTDLKHIVVWSPVSLTSGSYGGELYEVGEGQLQPIAIYPDGKPFEKSQAIRANLAGTGGEFGSAQRSISSDGRWIAWTAGDPYNEANVSLYVRDMATEKTIEVGGPHARYQTMNAEGSEIFYLEEGDLYLFDTETDTHTDLTAGHGAGETSASVDEAVSDVSSDGSYVYFVAEGDLAEGGVSGEPNLYLLHNTGGTWLSPMYIATLSREDEKVWHADSFGTGTSAPALADVSSRVSPDGKFFAFMSNRALTGYDNIDISSSPSKPQYDEEVYLYSADSGRLVCASCNPTGGRPAGVLDTSETAPLVDRAGSWNQTISGHDHMLAGSVPGWDEARGNRAIYQPRYLANSGRLFFDSPDALAAQATNGLEDVYEYEPSGVGSCKGTSVEFSTRSSGCVSLISSGVAGAESAFLDASETGDDVFFITASKLVGEDVDTAYDVYDARVCSTAEPCRSEQVSLLPCSTSDSCKPAPSTQPEIFGPPPSATFGDGVDLISDVKQAPAKPTSLTQRQRLDEALRKCGKKRGSKRVACDRRARRRYPIRQTRKARRGR